MTFVAEYRTVGKSDWQRGPWDDEPDKVQWRDEATGLPCLIHRSPLGFLCGYVGVAPGHRWHGVDYCDGRLVRIRVHGGLTYSASCQHGDGPETGICHVPEPGEPDDVWWFGFDCGHYGDFTDMSDQVSAWRLSLLATRSPLDTGSPGGIYRDVAYVKAECAALAAQLAEAAK